MPLDLSPFAPAPVGRNEIHNAGSMVLVAPLLSSQDGTTGATEYTIEVDETVAPAIGDTELTVKSTAACTLRKGSKLYFTGNKVVTVAATTDIATTNTALPVEALVSGNVPVDGDTATTWAMLALLSPTNIPLNPTDNFVDRKDLTYGLQGSEVKVGIMFEAQIQVIDQVTDTAYNKIVYPAATGSDRVYAHIVRNGGLHGIGAAFVSAPTNDGNINEISRPQFTLKFQAPFWIPARYNFLSASQKTALNNVCKLSGLAIYS